MKRAALDRLLAQRAAKQPVALVTRLDGGEQSLVTAEETHGDLALPLDVVAAARSALRSDRSGLSEAGANRYFIRVYNPPLRMAIIGAVHIAQVLAPMAILTGYEVTVIDPRRAFATEARFPGVMLHQAWPDEILATSPLGSRSALVALAHDPKIDDPALEIALGSRAFYVGALGSKKTHAARLERLSARGHEQEALARIHGPAGLAIGARSPAEIALSILAQMTQTLRT